MTGAILLTKDLYSLCLVFFSSKRRSSGLIPSHKSDAKANTKSPQMLPDCCFCSTGLLMWNVLINYESFCCDSDCLAWNSDSNKSLSGNAFTKHFFLLITSKDMHCNLVLLKMKGHLAFFLCYLGKSFRELLIRQPFTMPAKVTWKCKM